MTVRKVFKLQKQDSVIDKNILVQPIKPNMIGTAE